MKALIRHLRNAPITEAIVDFRVVQRKEFAVTSLLQAKERLANTYPIFVERKSAQVLVDSDKGRPSSARVQDLGLQGVWLKTSDEKNIGQYRVDGFTFNRLKPYTSWDQLDALPEPIPIALRKLFSARA